jgi:spermidine/putrescine transport system ATP-binding protein
MSDTVVVMDKGRIQQIGTARGYLQRAEERLRGRFYRRVEHPRRRHAGGLRGQVLRPRFKCVDSGFAKNEPVDVVIRPEDVDIVPPEDGQLCGTVTSVTFKGVHYDTIVDFHGFKWLIQTTDFCPVGSYHRHRLEPDDIHIMHSSEYSGLFGDYSSYSAEYDENDPDLYPEDFGGGVRDLRKRGRGGGG